MSVSGDFGAVGSGIDVGTDVVMVEGEGARAECDGIASGFGGDVAMSDLLSFMSRRLELVVDGVGGA